MTRNILVILISASLLILIPTQTSAFLVEPKYGRSNERNVFISGNSNDVFSRQKLYSATTTAMFSSSVSSLPEGLLKTITKEGNGPKVRLGDIATIKYTCYVSGNPTPFARSTSKAQKMVIGDSAMITGFEQAIRSMCVGERCMVQVTDASFGYGDNGVPPIVPSNAILDLDIEIIDTQPASANIDFDRLAEADNTPRTASDIAAAFAFRNEQKALNQGPELEGLDWFVAKVQSFYFFGLFEGETGERAPWFLRPSITFPIAFAIVGAAFYVSYIGGAISERGAQSTDELDEIILSSNIMLNAIAVALASLPVNL
jgi:FKBP-type peptidyl-prolyl cis-trans isomerase